MEEYTILTSIGQFILNNKDAIATSVLARGSYDVIKGALNVSSLKNRISKFFRSDEDTELYVKGMCEKVAHNSNKPERDVEDLYEEIANKEYKSELFEHIKEWILENKSVINSTINMDSSNNSGFIIGTQNADKIYNIKGDYNN